MRMWKEGAGDSAELLWVEEASPAELLEAARPHADLEAAARVIKANPSQLAQAHIGTVSHQMARHIVLAALGADDG